MLALLLSEVNIDDRIFCRTNYGLDAEISDSPYLNLSLIKKSWHYLGNQVQGVDLQMHVLKTRGTNLESDPNE